MIAYRKSGFDEIGVTKFPETAAPFSGDGKMSVVTLVWEKVK
jgi:hypothetical protein